MSNLTAIVSHLLIEDTPTEEVMERFNRFPTSTHITLLGETLTPVGLRHFTLKIEFMDIDARELTEPIHYAVCQRIRVMLDAQDYDLLTIGTPLTPTKKEN